MKQTQYQMHSPYPSWWNPTVKLYLDQSWRQNRSAVKELFHKHSKLFTNIPGLTIAAKLTIETDDAKPTRTNPRTVPKAWQGKVDKEIHTMLDTNIIEWAYGPWTSAIVPVSQTDGSVWACND